MTWRKKICAGTDYISVGRPRDLSADVSKFAKVDGIESLGAVIDREAEVVLAYAKEQGIAGTSSGCLHYQQVGTRPT